MSGNFYKDLDKAETLSELFLVIENYYDCSERLSFVKKTLFLTGLKKALLLLKPTPRT